jgi:hypothetical protein
MSDGTRKKMLECNLIHKAWANEYLFASGTNASYHKNHASDSLMTISPAVPQRAGARVGLRAAAEFAVELASSASDGVTRNSASADVNAELGGGAAPLTTKFAPGSVSNTAPSAGLVTQSCAQASRARNVSEHRGIAEAGAELAARIGGMHGVEGEPEATASDVGLAEGHGNPYRRRSR